MTFNVGDRVLYIGPAWKEPIGLTGTIIRDSGMHSHGPVRFQVKFDQRFTKGHDCGGACEYGYGFNVDLAGLRKIDEDLGDLEDDL